MTRVGWWHCPAGISGDMCLGALVDAGVPLAELQAAVDAVRVEPARLTAEPVTRHGLAATRVTVHVGRSTVVRTWANLRDLLGRAPLPEPVRAGAIGVFERLAREEAGVHRVAVDQVHFHEVGALDAVADVVGTLTGLHRLGLDQVVASPVATGIGMTRGEHGLLPVPGPAVLALLAEAEAPVYSGAVPHELCTPTGAAILAGTVRSWGGLPPVRLRAVGAGAGARDLEEVPNLVRLVVGDRLPDTAGPADALLVEANVDDLDPRLWPAVLARLLVAGADDAWLTPIVMKKGRPAHTVHVLAGGPVAAAVREVLFAETSTIGLRETAVAKRSLARAAVTVQVHGRPVRVKAARLDGRLVNVSPEYEDVAAVAAASGRPVKAVLAAAIAAAHTAGLQPGAPSPDPPPPGAG